LSSEEVGIAGDGKRLTSTRIESLFSSYLKSLKFARESRRKL
jgi:hypothetical protein